MQKSKICLISGGRLGIGRAICEGFLRRGVTVIVLGRNIKSLESTFKRNKFYNTKLFLYEADIRDYSRLAEVVKEIKIKFKRIDILVNNASVNFMIHSEKLLPNMIDLSIDTNLRGHIYLTTLVAKQMINQKGFKRIINITAYSGGKAYPGFSHFHACKSGMDALTRTLAIEWSKYNILINAISPGPILTDNFIHAYSRLFRLRGQDKKDFLFEMKEALPLRKFTKVTDVVNLALFLVSDSTTNITGQVIATDGGVGITNEFFLKNMGL